MGAKWLTTVAMLALAATSTWYASVLDRKQWPLTNSSVNADAVAPSVLCAPAVAPEPTPPPAPAVHWRVSNLSVITSRQRSAACIAAMPGLCNNRHKDYCTWARNDCGAPNLPDLRKLFRNRTIVMRGDSTLREMFSALAFFISPKMPGITKADASWNFRSLIKREEPDYDVQTFFKFDTEFSELLEPLKGVPPADIAIVSLGMYDARNFTNFTMRDVETYAGSLRRGICDVLNASVGIFLAQTIECKAQRKSNLATVKRMARSCPNTLQVLRAINSRIQADLQKQTALQDTDGVVAPGVNSSNNSSTATGSTATCNRDGGASKPTEPPRRRSCQIHFIPPFICSSNAQLPCTKDGVHSRRGSNYLSSKISILLNAMRVLIQEADGTLDPWAAAVNTGTVKSNANLSGAAAFATGG
jgi:hypothetical protein